MKNQDGHWVYCWCRWVERFNVKTTTNDSNVTNIKHASAVSSTLWLSGWYAALQDVSHDTYVGIYLQGGFAVAGRHPPAAPRTPVMVEDVRRKIELICATVLPRGAHIRLGSWRTRYPTPYTPTPWALNFNQQKAPWSAASIRLDTTQRCE